MTRSLRRSPWFAIALMILAGLPSLAQAIDFAAIESLPVQESGRKKPLLTFADESLLTITGRTSIQLDGRKVPAMEAITSIWLAPETWGDRQVILINHRGLKEAAGLEIDRKHFSHDELASTPAFLQLLQQASVARAKAPDGKLTGLNKEVEQVGLRLARFEALRNGSLFRIVANPAGSRATWQTLSKDDPKFAALRAAFLAGDDAAFTAAAADLRTALGGISPEFQPPAWKLSIEELYQKVHPFRWAWILYLSAGVVLAVTALRGQRSGYALGWTLALAGFLLQFGGFVARILIAGRPPVTNMYESIIWVAFGTVFFALIFEAIYRTRYFLLGAIPVAVVSLILADTQPMALDRSIQPLVAVLQDNFWLTTHVLTITLSYAAFALALGVAHIVLGHVIFGRKPSSALYNYIYRTLQVGVLLLAIGTILGGVWANYSWGRFWDWDPKETWALIALLVYLFILHGRLAGAWSGFGMAVGAVLAFQSIIMAWYGVNFVLGVGLHSYGFGSGGFGYALGFVGAELAFTLVAVLRHRSLRAADQARKASRPVPGAELAR